MCSGDLMLGGMGGSFGDTHIWEGWGRRMARKLMERESQVPGRSMADFSGSCFDGVQEAE